MEQKTKLDTIRNTYQRLRSDGYMISEAALRGWVRSGKIRRIPQGRKSLIFLEDVIFFLETFS